MNETINLPYSNKVCVCVCDLLGTPGLYSGIRDNTEITLTHIMIGVCCEVCMLNWTSLDC